MTSKAESLVASAWVSHARAELAAILGPDDSDTGRLARMQARTAIRHARRALRDQQDHVPAEELPATTAMELLVDRLAMNDPALLVAAPTSDRERGPRPQGRRSGAELQERLSSLATAFTAAASSIDIGGRRVGRLDILAAMTTEQDPASRFELFMSLEPLWRAVDGDGDGTSPYRAMVRQSAAAWRRDGSPIDANANSLGIDPSDVEPWLEAILEVWRGATALEPRQPWDDRFINGKFYRMLEGAASVEELLRINDEHYRSLGADPVALGIKYDLAPRDERARFPFAFMLDVDMPRHSADGWTSGEQWVFAMYAQPSLANLSELLHETGHAIHARAIRTRPAFGVLRQQSTTYIEALGDLAAWDMFEPAWQHRHLAHAIPRDACLRAKYGDVVRDVAWSLFEIRMHRNPDLDPNDLWSQIAADYLGILPHPEWSWWATRGQLVTSPGYMSNYGLGAIVTADLRARLRELRGEWWCGDPGWYDAVSDALYRWGSERDPKRIIEDFLDRPISPDALLEGIARVGTEP